MQHNNGVKIPAILPVLRTKDDARRLYDRISRYYDYFAGPFERKLSEVAIERLSIQKGETVLEIGFGTGHCLRRMAILVGEHGKVFGIDISSGMLEISQKRLNKAGVADRVKLFRGDAIDLPFDNNFFDAVFMSYTLELFDTPEIPIILEEVKRILRPGGRVGVVSMSEDNGEYLLQRLYKWAHRKWPRYFDCRPIYLTELLMAAGYEIKIKETFRLLRSLPVEIAIAIKQD